MRLKSAWGTLGLVTILLVSPSALAQPASKNHDPHIGYVYPAGGQAGTTVKMRMGGQYLEKIDAVYISGEGVTAEVLDHYIPLTMGQANRLRNKIGEARDKAEAEVGTTTKGGKRVRIEETAAYAKYLKEQGVTEEDLEKLEDYNERRNDTKRQINPQIDEMLTIEVAFAEDAEMGRREIRVQTPDGISNPLAFHVGHLPEHREVEPNDEKGDDSFEDVMPLVLNGQIMPGDVDRFRFEAKRGDRIIVEVKARALIPYLADAVPGWFQATLGLYDENNHELAYSDDHQFNPDPILFYRIPKSGQYEIEIKDSIYRGREDFVYRITIGEYPFVTSVYPLGGREGEDVTVEVKGWNLRVRSMTLDLKDRVPGIHKIPLHDDKRIDHSVLFAVDSLNEMADEEPNNDLQSAQSLKPPLVVNGRIDQPGDWDVFSFKGRAGGRIAVEVEARRLNSPLDSLLRLTDAQGKEVIVCDDIEDKAAGLVTHHADSQFCVTLPADGTYYIHLGDTQRQGGEDFAYRMRVSARQQDFELRVMPSSITAPAGTAVPITVKALRKDEFDGDIILQMKDPSSGFELSGGRIAGDQEEVQLTLTIPPDAPLRPISVQMEGVATVRGREVRRPVVPADDTMQAFIIHHFVTAQEFLVAVRGEGSPNTAKTRKEAGGQPAPVVDTKSAALVSFGDKPVKVPAGGLAEIRLPKDEGPYTGLVHVELQNPPEGVHIQRSPSSSAGTVLLVWTEPELVKVGMKGNLIVTAHVERAGKRVLVTLPAVPFEVIPEDASPEHLTLELKDRK
jgi:hypothetical protein